MKGMFGFCSSSGKGSAVQGTKRAYITVFRINGGNSSLFLGTQQGLATHCKCKTGQVREKET